MTNLPVSLPDALWLHGFFADYANPKARVGLLVRKGVLHRLKRGLYITSESAQNVYVLGKAANRLYGPSYVSFVYALRWHGLIPEHVSHITSATYRKGRSKRYDTPVGTFFYQDVPAAVYSHGVGYAGEGQERFLIASPEKALCDELYRIRGIRSLRRMKELLFEDLRVDHAGFDRLDREALIECASGYASITLDTLLKYLRLHKGATC